MTVNSSSLDVVQDMMQLKNANVFCDLSQDVLARLYPHLSKWQFQTGTPIITGGTEADSFFVLISGTAIESPSEKPLQHRANGFLGMESLIGANTFQQSVNAVDDCICIRVPVDIFCEVVPTPYRTRLSEDWIRHRLDATTDRYGDNTGHRSKPTVGATWNAFTMLGWVMTIALPAAILFFGRHLDWSKLNFMAAFSATVVMWIFKLVPPYVAGLFTVLACSVLGVAPHNIALSGFASSSFFMTLSIFGIGTVLVNSQLSYRLVLLILKHCPPTPFWTNFSVLVAGILLTPILPGTNGRVGLLSPLLKDLCSSLGLKAGSDGATRLSISMFSGLSMFSAVFLTSKSLNLLIFGLLSTQRQNEFQWVHWFTSASFTGVLLLLAVLLVTSIAFRKVEPPKLSKEHVEAQLTLLGPLTRSERIAFSAVGVFMLFVILSSFHKINPAWIAFAVMFALLIIGALGKKELMSGIDWTFLLLLGSMIGLVKVMEHVGLNADLSRQLDMMESIMTRNFILFVAVLMTVILVLRLFLPINAAAVLAATVFLPIAQSNGINTWVVAFIILSTAECWFFPYQASYFIMFDELTRDTALFNRGRFLRTNYVLAGCRLAIVFATLPFFHWLGYL